MAHNCGSLNSINIRKLKNQTSEVLERVAMGESLEVRRRNTPLAVLKPMDPENQSECRPDFRRRLRDVYGDQCLPTSATEMLAEERGVR